MSTDDEPVRAESLYVSALHLISPTPGTLAVLGREVARILREQGRDVDDSLGIGKVREVTIRVVSS